MFTVDTRAPNCPIRIVYTHILHGHSIHLYELNERPYIGTKHRPLALIRGTEHGDGRGGAEEASNHRVLWRAFGGPSEGRELGGRTFGGLVRIFGPCGYQALAYDVTLGPVPGDDELRDVLYALEHAPAVDDGDRQELEDELRVEAWQDHGLAAFRRALTVLFDEIDSGYRHALADDDAFVAGELVANGLGGIDSTAATWEELLCDLWVLGRGVRGLGHGMTIEAGCTVRVHVDEWVAAARQALADGDTGGIHPLNTALRALSKVCRHAGGDAGGAR